MFGLLFWFSSIVCFVYDCMDAYVVLYDHVQSVSFALVTWKKLVIQKKSFGGYNSIEEWSEFKASLLSYTPLII